MSYILDALKKIDHEKNKKNRADGRINISGDLFQERSQPASGTGIVKIVTLVVAASLVTGAGTWFVLQKTGDKNVSRINPAPPHPPVPATPPAAPTAIPVPLQPQAAPLPSAPVAAPAISRRLETVADDESSPPQKPGRLKIQAKSRALPPKQPVNTVPAPADIKLSGIAWQDDRSARRAVVNGFLLKEGAVVSGARIVDIHADRVRFSSPAGSFEVLLDAVLPARGH